MGIEIDKYIQAKVKEILDKDKFPEYDDVHSDTFSELIDKLIIVHIRVWYVEDALNTEKDPKKFMQLKRKSDVAFKEKRPALVKAIDKTITNICTGKFNPTAENPKLYEGYAEYDAEKESKK
tara:strand:- start:3866 stop:4231 length:366 start_codon:yes stop_codon:yes gene_type:complete